MADTPVPTQSALRTALAGLIGNVLEWFDFAVYGYFASNIGQQFFTQSSHTAQQFLTFGTFALGFLARPVGSLVLGRVGDRIGRRAPTLCATAALAASSAALGISGSRLWSVYLFGTLENWGYAGISTFVIAATDRPIDFAAYKQFVTEGGKKRAAGNVCDETLLNEYLAKSDPILLTDDHVPTDILVAPLFRRLARPG